MHNCMCGISNKLHFNRRNNMNELKFNSQICTTKEQSQRLLKLGLKRETADMLHMQIDSSEICIISQGGEEEYVPYEVVPAWSLHRLIEIYNTPNDNCYVVFTNTAFDDLIDDIEWCINNKGRFNKEYFKQ